jgi:hypothetical protein
LARLEARIAFEQLLVRLPGLRLAADNDFAYLETPLFRGAKHLYIEFEVDARAAGERAVKSGLRSPDWLERCRLPPDLERVERTKDV